MFHELCTLNKMCAPQIKDSGLLAGRPFSPPLDAFLPLALAAYFSAFSLLALKSSTWDSTALY